MRIVGSAVALSAALSVSEQTPGDAHRLALIDVGADWAVD
jgi:hypothetical protein